MTEVPNTSISLRERHGKTYHELYSRCFLVTSAPATFCWAGEYTHHIGAPIILQNLPLRISVGLEQLKVNGRIEIVDLMYVPSVDQFKSQMNPVHRKKLERYITELCTMHFGSPNFPGLRIHSLSEVPFGSGLSASGAFASALAVALLLANGKLQSAEIAEWSSLRTPLLPQNRAFDKTFRLAWKIATLLHDGISTGSTAFSALIGSVYPLVYYSERRGGLTLTSEDPRVPLNVRENYQLLDRLFYGGIKLDELFGWKDQPTWPVDCYLIYSGKRGGGRLTKSVGEIDDTLAEIGAMLDRSFGFTKSEPNAFTPLFYQLFQKEGPEGMRMNYLGTPAVLVLQVLYGLREIFELGSSERSIHNLLEALNWFHDSMKFLGRWTPEIDSMTSTLRTRLPESLGIDEVGVKMTGSGRGGDLLVVTASDGAQETIEAEVQHLRTTSHRGAWLDYASPRDGWEDRGILIEQYLKESLYSPFVTKGSVVLSVFSQQGQSSITLSLEEFERTKMRFPLFIDSTTDELSILGRVLTSKQLKSSKATVAFLNILLSRIGQILPKSDLPTNSYTVDRNELQSKIIGPLQTVLRRTLKQILPLSVRGPVRQYTVTLNSPPFDIVLLSRRV